MIAARSYQRPRSRLIDGMNEAPPACDHQGFHSGQARYSHSAGRLRYVIVCDGCMTELREVGGVQYRPAFDAAGSARHRQAGA